MRFNIKGYNITVDRTHKYCYCNIYYPSGKHIKTLTFSPLIDTIKIKENVSLYLSIIGL